MKSLNLRRVLSLGRLKHGGVYGTRFNPMVVSVAVVVGVSADTIALGQPGMVNSFQKISETQGGFGGNLDNADLFGHGVTNIGDVDGDGITDLAVGVFGDDDGGFNTGAVWILFLNTDGTVKAEQKISDTQGGLSGDLSTNGIFGVSLDGIGDLDGDGVPDLAVGNYGDDDGGLDRGAIWILFLNTDGTVNAEQKISDTQGGFNGTLSNSDLFGSGVADVGDLDSDGVTDLAVGAWMDNDGGSNRGAIWILFLNTDGTVKSEQKISDTQGGFGGTLDNGDQFGTSVANIGDLDGDGVTDLAVGAFADDDGGTDRGAVWVLFMKSDGTVNAEQKISDTVGGFAGALDDVDWFGRGVAGPGDLDSDGTLDLTVAVRLDDDGGVNRGALWVLFMNSNGTVRAEQKISDTEGGFEGTLDDGDSFGSAVAGIGDLNGDGGTDLVVGAIGDDDGNDVAGAVWILFLEPGVITADLDIKSGSCPNSFNRSSHGVLPVALVGTDTFDPTEVDLSTVLLSRADGVGGSVAPNEGPPGPHSEFEDVASPFDGQPCDCHELEGDGFTDLSMKFKTDDVVADLQLNDLPAGDLVELILSGDLLDGTPFSGRDCIRLVPPGTPPGLLAVGSNLSGNWLDVSPLDLQLDGGGFANFERTFPQTTVVTLTAPQMHHGWRFVGWRVGLEGSFHGGGLQPGQSIEMTIRDDVHRIEAIYRPALLHDLHEH
ncbi:MAG: FG-GAP repeat protein [Planctomycetes bacterium]|nr:FG-GAP repeat protein [Planctomycetota bacterium]